MMPIKTFGSGQTRLIIGLSRSALPLTASITLMYRLRRYERLAEQIASANAVWPPWLQPDALGPAWLRCPFGVITI